MPLAKEVVEMIDVASRRVCANCKFWQECRELPAQAEWSVWEVHGECRYNPPPWQACRGDDWCRRFEQRNDSGNPLSLPGIERPPSV